MSSRSNGVTKVLLTRWMIARVVLSACALGLAHLLGLGGAVGALGEHLRQQPRARDQVLGRLGEQGVERAVHRTDAEGHGYSWEVGARTVDHRGGPPGPGCNSGVGPRRSQRPAALALDQALLEVHLAVVLLPRAVAVQQPGVGVGVEGQVEQPAHLVAAVGVRQPDQHLDAPVEVAVHQVGRADPGLGLAAVLEPEHPAVLEEAPQDRAHLDGLRQPRHARAASAQMPRTSSCTGTPSCEAR